VVDGKLHRFDRLVLSRSAGTALEAAVWMLDRESADLRRVWPWVVRRLRSFTAALQYLSARHFSILSKDALC